ncbi:hypothetical protein WG68_01600 [Arsukibacterium ikkense]|uniref:KfrA N-terminal DNA-binding domain-containing protein n=1 Tax=Arsukibacterium ikkense TaxID=336831 RepID=A0A0M2VA82_9GAMM|nr:hypothetical protein [Arsukibacterium ikkense]KKO47354.1 hypothetical protein WG68_01600 [Arsukibacterium ikkense]
MNSASELLQQTATRLRQEGKTPSLALFKARLGSQLTAPALFAAYQQWRQHAGNLAAGPDSVPPPSAANPALNVTAAIDSTQLQRIEAKLDKILALLEQQNVSG